jgi:hypothetical protein
MTLSRNDAVTTAITGLAVLTFLATVEPWSVPGIGTGHRWAAAAILGLGIPACRTGATRAGLALLHPLGEPRRAHARPRVLRRVVAHREADRLRPPWRHTSAGFSLDHEPRRPPQILVGGPNPSWHP